MNASRIPNTALAAELTELLSVVDPYTVADVLLRRAFDHRATDVHLDPTPAGVRSTATPRSRARWRTSSAICFSLSTSATAVTLHVSDPVYWLP